MSLLRVENLSFVYSQGTPFEKLAVDDISFEINRNEFIGIIGHTGSGKSTLVQMLNGLLKPSKGRVYFNDEDVWAKPKEIKKLRFHVGLTFQYPEYQLFEETVYKDIAFGPKNMGLSEEQIKEKVLKACDFVSLKRHSLEKSPFDLSGGQKRRAAIAGVIAMDPEILILDEPTAGLDPIGRELLLSQIKQYQMVNKSTVILVSHSMEDVAEICDKVMVLKDGKLEMFDSTGSVFSQSEKLSSMSLRLPEITQIIQRLADNGINIPRDILTVESASFEISEYMKREGLL